MALASLLNPKCSIKAYTFPLCVSLIPNISSSLFSSLCRGHPFSSPPDAPPVPKKVPFTVTAHGRTWQDPYHWMSDTNDHDLSEYLSRENSYAESFMADTHHLQRKLFCEMTSRMPTTISTPPERWGPWFVHFPPTHFVFLEKFCHFISFCEFCVWARAPVFVFVMTGNMYVLFWLVGMVIDASWCRELKTLDCHGRVPSAWVSKSIK